MVTNINWNKLLAVDIERPCNLWDEYLEETECEGETDLTAPLREGKDLLVKFLYGQDVTPEQVQKALRKVKVYLQNDTGRVVHGAHANTSWHNLRRWSQRRT